MTPATRIVKRPALIAGLLVFACVAPVVLAWAVYANLEHWRPGTTNHGELIAPPRPLDGFALQRVDGAVFDARYLHGKWTLIYIGAPECADECRRTLYHMRQVRLALGPEASRVQRLLALPGPAQADALRHFLKEYPGMVVATGSAASWQDFVKRLDGAGAGSGAAGRIYVVDPLGNLMMTYPRGAAPKGMLKDLQRLLKVSQIG